MMLRQKIFIFIMLLMPFVSGCAFFNTFYHARKSYNNAVDIIDHHKEKNQSQLSSSDVSADRFSLELKTVLPDANQFLDVAIEKANKVVVLYPKSGWAEDATLLLGKAHYLRAYTNDLYDAKNRLEVFMARYPESKKIEEAKLWYGKTLLKLNLIDDAAEQFRQVSEFAEKSNLKAESLIFMGDIAVNDEDYADACKYYAAASEMAKDKSVRKSALYKTFYTYFHTGNFKLAAGYLNVLTRMDLEVSEKFDVFFMLARTQKMAGQYNEAIRMLNGLIGNLRYKNYFVKAEFEIADALRLAGKNSEAVKQFNYVIDVYKNPNFTGDCYYFLGVIYDKPIVSQTGSFVPDPELAKKYYYLVKTKYTNSPFYTKSSERYDYLTKMDMLKGSIQWDETLLHAIDRRIRDSAFVPNSYFSTEDTASLTDLDLSAASEAVKAKAITDSKNEVSKGLLSNPELEEKIQQVQLELLDIGQTTHPDTLAGKRSNAFDALASGHILLADYFYFNLSEYDSADFYYQYVIDHFNESPILEFALYGHARIQQKKNSPDYLSLYEFAYNEFPNGKLADIGRRVLSLEEDMTDSIQAYFKQAEDHFFRKQNYAEALQSYTKIALSGSADHKLQALYAMGILYEKQLNNSFEAFRTYNTLIFAGPNSDFAKKAKPKVDAYAKENKITQDSLVFWVNRDFFEITMPNVKTDTAHSQADSVTTIQKDSSIDSNRGRIPGEYLLPDEEVMPADTLRANKNKKNRNIKSPIKPDEAIREKENDNIIEE
ncbi:tetratricopeptide repeat protein [bacterium]|nr:tetratricopeptide repeat protein [bacterium]